MVPTKQSANVLTVAAPPTSVEHARQVAIEHHAFCPDLVTQAMESFDEYVNDLVGNDLWWFWWD
ncbi:DUF4253 domain-containing protein [Amycolatopsis taiwanensis]|uniref:DUF4253 domain-containing protein n=1 Tax=Amycolatopsis taiwanensis TaxID=342230 RepID=A0A9W6R0F3_9PSEU|nr:DUF4253 domain-containing protein [Amycolatopsis taiwanensis]GLY65357.1 hypothetical protein Atai01_19760 [Amycolatopsis taiwanensis]